MYRSGKCHKQITVTCSCLVFDGSVWLVAQWQLSIMQWQQCQLVLPLSSMKKSTKKPMIAFKWLLLLRLIYCHRFLRSQPVKVPAFDYSAPYRCEIRRSSKSHLKAIIGFLDFFIDDSANTNWHCCHWIILSCHCATSQTEPSKTRQKQVTVICLWHFPDLYMVY